MNSGELSPSSFIIISVTNIVFIVKFICISKWYYDYDNFVVLQPEHVETEKKFSEYFEAYCMVSSNDSWLQVPPLEHEPEKIKKNINENFEVVYTDSFWKDQPSFDYKAYLEKIAFKYNK